MKKPSRWLTAILAVALLVAGPGAGLAQQSYYFYWDVVDERGQVYTGQNVRCSVFDPNGTGAKVLHTNANLTAGNTLPLVSDAQGKLHFYSSSGDAVDVVCRYGPGGGMASVNKLTRFLHRIVLDRQGRKAAFFSVTQGVGDSGTTASGISIPAGARITDVVVQNLNPRGVASDFHVSVGFAGNHAVAANVNALVSAMALTSPDEWLRPHVQSTVVSNVYYFSTSHRGTALQRFSASHGSGTGSLGMYAEVPYLVHVSTGLDVNYATRVPASGQARLHIYILYDQFHTGINRQGLTN